MTEPGNETVAATSSPVPSPPLAPALPPESALARAGKALVAMALVALAIHLGWSRWDTTSVDWYLGNLRQDPADPEARAAFARMGERALPRLEQELATADDNGRVIATLALACVAGPGAERVLASLAADKDAFLAANAVAACGARRDLETARALARALADDRSRVRYAARFAAQQRSGGVPWWAFGAAGGG
jgi:HEAT repeat protein